MKSENVVLLPSADFFQLVLETLDSPDKRVEFTPGGRSMLPMLRDRADAVLLGLPVDPIRKYDVALFRRDSGTYAIHRVVKVCSDGTFVFCGDGQTVLEREIRRDQILAIVREFRRGARKIDCYRSLFYRTYSRVWVFLWLPRAIIRRGIHLYCILKNGVKRVVFRAR